ncbi:g6889 [Coccomyxa viridis]|uniref:G6889 protein n=1 Tax=Coccomyxa viridis TaxID=1274662 RepID=A0ABP1G355_9CHLO
MVTNTGDPSSTRCSQIRASAMMGSAVAIPVLATVAVGAALAENSEVGLLTAVTTLSNTFAAVSALIFAAVLAGL